MAAFHLTGIDNATMTKDRSTFEINFRSDKGPLALTLSAEHLDSLITMLEGLEYHASLHDPVHGQRPGERGQIRAKVVDSHRTMNGDVNGTPSVFLGLKSTQSFKWFALDRARAEAIKKDLEVEITKLEAPPSSH